MHLPGLGEKRILSATHSKWNRNCIRNKNIQRITSNYHYGTYSSSVMNGVLPATSYSASLFRMASIEFCRLLLSFTDRVYSDYRIKPIHKLRMDSRQIVNKTRSRNIFLENLYLV